MDIFYARNLRVFPSGEGSSDIVLVGDLNLTTVETWSYSNEALSNGSICELFSNLTHPSSLAMGHFSRAPNSVLRSSQ